MFYLTAHLVFSQRLNRSGTNAFMYKREGFLTTSGDPFFQIDQISQSPGQVVAMNTQIPPGGNTVLGYLDIVMNEDTSVPQLDDSIKNGHTRMQRAVSNELAFSFEDGMILRIYANPSHTLGELYSSLSASLVDLYASHSMNPLVITREREGDADVFRLDTQSASRLRDVHGEQWIAAPVRVADDIRGSIEETYGNMLPHIIEMVTGLREEIIRGIGGVILIDARSGESTSWP